MGGKTIQQKALELTGTFETSRKPPGCYSSVSGNFDGAGISFGVLQFNIKSGTLEPILNSIIINNSLSSILYKNSLDILKEILKKPIKDQLKWAKSITTKRGSVITPWKDLFTALGTLKECQEAQLRATQYYLSKAQSYMSLFGVYSERAFALCFDVAVQNGSFGVECYQTIVKIINLSEAKDELTKLIIMADIKADFVKSKWQDDVRNRKLTIATGEGRVHGVKVDLERDYGITLNKALL